MRSQQLNLEQYDTDKIGNRYLEQYDPILEPWVKQEIKLLEIGIHKGGSLLLWRDYFPLGTIIGIDKRLPKDLRNSERIRLFSGGQEDPIFLSDVANKVAPEGFDIIIDDASHIAELTRRAFWHLFDNHLKPGGLYAIEDWGTGYLDDWPDGKAFDSGTAPAPDFWSRLLSRLKGRPTTPLHSHDYGMVGFVKELVDEQGAANLTKRILSGSPTRLSRFESLQITSGIVFVTKAANQS